jgi:hypothetical protein
METELIVALESPPGFEPSNNPMGEKSLLSLKNPVNLNQISIPEPSADKDYEEQGFTPSIPPGFPFHIYQKEHFNITVGAMQFLSDVADPVPQKMLPDLSDDQLLGKEGASLWNKHFAHSSDADKVVQVPIEWTNFSLALLSLERFDWAKSLLSSQIWNYILEGSDSNVFKPFVIPDKCTSSQAPACKLQALMEDDVPTQLPFSTPQSKSSGKNVDLQPSSTSTNHANKKRKDKPP